MEGVALRLLAVGFDKNTLLSERKPPAHHVRFRRKREDDVAAVPRRRVDRRGDVLQLGGRDKPLKQIRQQQLHGDGHQYGDDSHEQEAAFPPC